MYKSYVINNCRECDNFTNNLLWCSELCAEVWKLKSAGEYRPSWELSPEERKTAAIYQEETDPRFVR